MENKMLYIGEGWELDVDPRGNLVFVFDGRIKATLKREGMLLVKDAVTTQDYEPTHEDLEQMQHDARRAQQLEALRILPIERFYES